MKTMLTQNIIMDDFFFFSKCLPLKTRRRFEKKKNYLEINTVHFDTER